MPVRSGRYAALKYGGYALLLLGLFLLQSARGTALRLWGGALDALPFFVAAAALLEGPFAGGSLGFAAGLLLSVNSTMAEGLWPATRPRTPPTRPLPHRRPSGSTRPWRSWKQAMRAWP